MKSEVYLRPLPSPVSKSIPLPPDEVLTGLPLLLDVSQARQALNAAGAQVEEGRIFYLRYKPKTSCIAAYEFERKNSATGEREPVIFYAKGMATNGYLLSAVKAENHRWVEVPFGPSVARWDEACALLFAFPNDALLDGLRILEEPKKFQRFLCENVGFYPASRWRLSAKHLVTELVRYKPERRAVFRSRIRAYDRESRHKEKRWFYWRVYGEGQGSEVFRRMQFLKNRLSNPEVLAVPTPYGYEPERQILLMEALGGKSLVKLLPTGESGRALERVALALAGLHRLSDENLPLWRTADFLSEAEETRKMLSFLLPEHIQRVGEVFNKLQSRAPEARLEAAFVHGDFYYGQVRVGSEKVRFIDFDRSHTGNPLLDLGNFVAHLRLLERESRVNDGDKLSRTFTTAYEEASKRNIESGELGWWTALALFFLAVTPFRRLEAQWPEKTLELLQTAEEILC